MWADIRKCNISKFGLGNLTEYKTIQMWANLGANTWECHSMALERFLIFILLVHWMSILCIYNGINPTILIDAISKLHFLYSWAFMSSISRKKICSLTSWRRNVVFYSDATFFILAIALKNGFSLFFNGPRAGPSYKQGPGAASS